jgi:CubicO group peptidase (beta-lactamase class C family)
MIRWFHGVAALALATSAAAQVPVIDPTPGKRAPSVLFASVPERDALFSAMHRHYPHRVVKAGRTTRLLPAGAPLTVAVKLDDRELPLDQALADQQATGILILHDGKVRFERYARTHSRAGRWPAFSVTKSFTSTLVGAALQDGAIRSLDDPVTRYIPELAGSGYDGVTVRQLLTMTSGVRWSEEETDPNSDLARFLTVEPDRGMGSTVSYMRKLPRAHPPGTRWNYNTGETNLIGVVVERATRSPLSGYLSRKIWQPYGMERDAVWATDRTGHEIGGGGLALGLRDLARFGQFVLDGGIISRRHVVPKGWFAEAGSKQADFGSPRSAYGYQWWVLPDGSFAGGGIYGQGLFIDPKRRVVVALAGNWPTAWSPKLEAKRVAIFRGVQHAIDADRTHPN